MVDIVCIRLSFLPVIVYLMEDVCIRLTLAPLLFTICILLGNVVVEYVRVPVGTTRRQMIEKSFEAPEDEKDIAPFDLKKQWAWANKVLFGPQRDMKNYPSYVDPGTVPRPEIVHKFVPRSLFDAMVPYSGVTGK